MQEAWHQILTQLTGARLAVYDELIRQDKLPPAIIAKYTADSCDQAIDWLEAHHLITRAEDGRLAARAPSHACKLWESTGTVMKAQPARPTASKAAMEPPERRAVHTHQTHLFDL